MIAKDRVSMVYGLVTLLFVLGGAGCSMPAGEEASDKAPVSSKEMTRHTLQHGGLEREYFVYLPSSYDDGKNHPVAIFLHGYGGTATGTEAEVAQGLNRYAEKYGYVMVYPQGTWFMSGDTPDTQWEVTSWNHVSDGFDKGPSGPTCAIDALPFPCPPECGTCGQCGWTSCYDDIGFLKFLVATVRDELRVDAGEFFVSGFSNGAMMANRIACEASDLFAAVAMIGGRVEAGFECTPTHRLPLLQVTGGRDEVVPFDGRLSSDSYFYASTESVATHWNDGMACAGETEIWTSPTIDGEDVQCTSACSGTEYESIDCIWPKGDHRWPGTVGFRGSNGQCVSELQSASMPDQLICLQPDPATEFWGSRLLFEFFDKQRGI